MLPNIKHNEQVSGTVVENTENTNLNGQLLLVNYTWSKEGVEKAVKTGKHGVRGRDTQSVCIQEAECSGALSLSPGESPFRWMIQV